MEKWARFPLTKCNLTVGDVRPYFYSVAVGFQKEQRNLWRYSFGTRGRRNQSHKNRVLNRVLLNWLLELHRNGHSFVGRAPRRHTLFTRIQLKLNKVMLHFQPALTTAFLDDTWYHRASNALLPSSGRSHTAGRACVGGGLRNCWVLLWRSRSDIGTAVSSEVPQHTGLLRSWTLYLVCFIFHLLADSEGKSQIRCGIESAIAAGLFKWLP